MKTHLEIEHIAIEVKSSFTEFTYQLEKALGILNPSLLSSAEGLPASMISFLHDDGDEDSLVLFNILEFDELLKHRGQLQKVKQYQIGNAALAIQMTQRDPAAGLHIPMRVIVYEDQNGKLKIEYDLPSSLFANSNDRSIKEAGLILDEKLVALISKAENESVVSSSL